MGKREGGGRRVGGEEREEHLLQAATVAAAAKYYCFRGIQHRHPPCQRSTWAHARSPPEEHPPSEYTRSSRANGSTVQFRLYTRKTKRVLCKSATLCICDFQAHTLQETIAPACG